MPQAQTQQVPVGAFFGLPGYTQPFEQYENLNGIVTPLSVAAQTPWNPPGSLQKTDIVKWWEMETIVTWGTIVSASTISPEAPYNFHQSLKLKLQGQYTPIEVESGFDAAFFQMFRPMRGAGQASVNNLLGATALGSNAGAFANTTIPQVNQTTTGIVANPAAASTWTWMLEIPGGLYMDAYWDLAIDGTLMPNSQGVVAPMSAFVSPQYMGGGERVVVPSFNYAAIAAANADQGPLTGSAEATPASVLQNLRRVGYYGSANPAELPPVFNWQYRRASKRYPIGAATKVDIPITEYGQLLSCGVRIFDPTAGTYYTIANISKAQLLYGSNLPRFDDDVYTMQQRFQDQHGFVPPQSMVYWDMLANTSGQGLSNDFKVLNTLTNANTHVHLEMSPAPNPTAYAVVLSELLVPVATQ